jgi:putative membrane protein
MKSLNLFGLLVIGACTFQACNSPENRGGGADSAATDSSRTDSTGLSMSGSSKDSMPADVTNQSKVDTEEAAFMKKAAIGGMMEVDLGKIAQKSTNPKVKAFADQMVTDHTKANTELTALAAKTGVVLPVAYPAEEKAHMDMMKKMTGAAFDKHYIGMMVTDHDKTVALFKSAETSQDKGVSDFVKKTLPVITGHFEKAKAIQAELK